jgi:dihydroceramidase
MLYKIFTLPSSIEWCEKNYIYSPYIAEFWNTISGSILCLSSLMFYYFYINNVKEYNKHIYNANYWLFIVGVGTILFHGSLLYIFQLLDEIPMLLITIEYMKLNIKIGEELHIQNDIFNNAKLFVKIYIPLIFCIISSYYIYPQLQSFIFMIAFAYSVIIVFFQMKKIQERLHLILNNSLNYNYNGSKKNRNRLVKNLSMLTMFIFVSSLIIWISDSLFCKYFEIYKLHAIWHVLTSIGIYLCNVIMNMHVQFIKLS